MFAYTQSRRYRLVLTRVVVVMVEAEQSYFSIKPSLSGLNLSHFIRIVQPNRYDSRCFPNDALDLFPSLVPFFRNRAEI
ncbi:hypothetical protein DFH27DRAFT_556063 [Peziza echinospora]|nr:hypothetical protein DFH27DRAFT_556063 [Peziza echinospora]